MATFGAAYNKSGSAAEALAQSNQGDVDNLATGSTASSWTIREGDPAAAREDRRHTVERDQALENKFNMRSRMLSAGEKRREDAERYCQKVQDLIDQNSKEFERRARSSAEECRGEREDDGAALSPTPSNDGRVVKGFETMAAHRGKRIRVLKEKLIEDRNEKDAAIALLVAVNQGLQQKLVKEGAAWGERARRGGLGWRKEQLLLSRRSSFTRSMRNNFDGLKEWGTRCESASGRANKGECFTVPVVVSDLCTRNIVSRIRLIFSSAAFDEEGNDGRLGNVRKKGFAREGENRFELHFPYLPK